MKFIAMKFREKQAEWFAKRRINWHVSSVVVRQEESLEVTWYVHLLNSCKQDWLSVLSVLENLFVTIKLQNSGIIKAFLRSDEAGCYHLYESSDIKIATFSNLHKRACAFGERLMLGLESLFGKIKIAIFPQKKWRIWWRRFHFSPLLLDELHQQEKAMMATTVVPINALNLVAMKILRPRPTLTSIWTS